MKMKISAMFGGVVFFFPDGWIVQLVSKNVVPKVRRIVNLLKLALVMFESSKCRNESRSEPDPKTFHLYTMKYSMFIQM